MFGVAGLGRHVDLDLVDGEAHTAAVVLDVDDVEAEVGQQAGQAVEFAGPVLEEDAQQEVPPGGGEAVADHPDQQRGIDVPAGEQQAGGAAVSVRQLAGQCRGQWRRPGRFDHRLRALQEEEQGPGQVLLRDGDDLVHQGAHVGQGEVRHPFDGDAVGHGVDPVERHGVPGGQRGGHRRRALGLDADHFDAGPEGLESDRHPADQSSAADRDHHDPGLGRLLGQFEADRPLPGDDQRIVERRHEHGTRLLRVRQRRRPGSHRRPRRPARCRRRSCGWPPPWGTARWRA